MKNEGFTLIEILIALSIAAITITTLYKLHIQNISTTSSQLFYTIAPLLAQEKISEIKDENIKDIKGAFDEEFSDYKFNIKTEKILTENFNKLKTDVTITNYSNSYTLRKYIFIEAK
ncbi:MAG: prepilin-type N-terminal cleavage/methylation domain-containing protein [Desulfobacterales bacterium]|nr:prepilin-type N-terminal cleavage/methylation domain-containing protein [Desulfobacterales bacterium]